MLEYFTVQEFAAALRINEKTVRKQIDAGQVHAVKLGTVIRIPATELERLTR